MLGKTAYQILDTQGRMDFLRIIGTLRAAHISDLEIASALEISEAGFHNLMEANGRTTKQALKKLEVFAAKRLDGLKEQAIVAEIAKPRTGHEKKGPKFCTLDEGVIFVGCCDYLRDKKGYAWKQVAVAAGYTTSARPAHTVSQAYTRAKAKTSAPMRKHYDAIRAYVRTLKDQDVSTTETLFASNGARKTVAKMPNAGGNGVAKVVKIGDEFDRHTEGDLRALCTKAMHRNFCELVARLRERSVVPTTGYFKGQTRKLSYEMLAPACGMKTGQGIIFAVSPEKNTRVRAYVGLKRFETLLMAGHSYENAVEIAQGRMEPFDPKVGPKVVVPQYENGGAAGDHATKHEQRESKTEPFHAQVLATAAVAMPLPPQGFGSLASIIEMLQNPYTVVCISKLQAAKERLSALSVEILEMSLDDTAPQPIRDVMTLAYAPLDQALAVLENRVAA